MHQHRQLSLIDRFPDRLELRLGQVTTTHVRRHKYAHRTLATGSVKFGHRQFRVLPGQSCHPADAVGMRNLRGVHVVVDDARCCRALLGGSPINARRGE